MKEKRRRKEGREAEEGEHEKVEKDAVVTRSTKKRKRTVQIFVEVLVFKATLMEASLTDDQVHDVSRQIPDGEDVHVVK